MQNERRDPTARQAIQNILREERRDLEEKNSRDGLTLSELVTLSIIRRECRESRHHRAG